MPISLATTFNKFCSSARKGESSIPNAVSGYVTSTKPFLTSDMRIFDDCFREFIIKLGEV